MAYTYRHGDRPLEGYTIQRAVGRGGFGEVYYAVSDGGREVALKYLRENPNVELRGISHCMNLKSPHLVSIFDVRKNDQGDYFVIMEYVSGPSLRDLLLAEPAGLGPQKAAFFIREIAKGLAYLHDRGIVHRDMKPGNIFYDEGYVKIGDYGLSKFISVSRHSAQTASVGTVHYMAPEVGSGNYHRGIDIYALGVMLYEMLLGKVPFEGGSMGEVLMKHLTAQPEVDNLPAPFGKVIRKALEKDPADRYQSVYEMVDDLLEVSDVQTSLAGFNPASLSTVARHPGADAFDSPAPSPNPPPRKIPAAARAFVVDLNAGLPPKMAKRITQIEDKVNKKLRKLGAKHGKRPPTEPKPRTVNTPPQAPAHVAANAPHSAGEVVQRALLALAMAVGLGVGLGFLVDAREEGFASAIMMIIGMSGGLTLGMRLVAYASRRTPQPRWIERICMTVPTAALLGIGVAPFADRAANESAALAAWLALLVVTFFANWREHAETGSHGEMSIWRAGKVALFAFIMCAIFNAGPNHGQNSGLALAAGVAAATSFVMQALGWLFPLVAWLDGVPVGLAAEQEEHVQDARSRGLRALWRSARGPFASLRVGMHHDVPPQRAPVGEASLAPSGYGAPPADAPSFVVTGPPRRLVITRLFAGLLLLVSLAACLALTVRVMTARDRVVERTYFVHGDPVTQQVTVMPKWKIPAAAAAAGSFGLVMLAARKLRRFRTGGFYRDTLRPVLMALVMASLAGIAMTFDVAKSDPSAQIPWAIFIPLILLSMAFLFLLVKRGARYPDAPQAEIAGDGQNAEAGQAVSTGR